MAAFGYHQQAADLRSCDQSVNSGCDQCAEFRSLGDHETNRRHGLDISYMHARMHISDQRLPDQPSLEIHPDVVLQRPHLAAFFGLIVATWADIEGRLDAIFLLCANDRGALAEMQTIKGWDARSKFFIRHLKSQQGDALAIEVRAILRYVALPANKRHDIAHGIWAVCKELPDDLVVANSDIYTGAMEEALRAEAEGGPKLVLNKDRMLDTARVVSAEHLSQLLAELREARSLMHNFMIQKMPAVVHVHNREALPRAADHPDIAERIRNAEAGIKKRDKGRPSAD